MTLETLEYELIGGWARITLNRPEKRNALSAQMLDELRAVLWEADEDRAIRAVLLRGAGPSFCSGYDMGRDARTTVRHRDGAKDFRGIRHADDDIWQIEQNQRRMLTIFDMHKPVVAQVHGNVLAGGIDLMVL
ncbi:MAG: enoyl-CoA hydratase-related protein, partial [Acidimicrobiia bacterium]|nr:enoyl-CoA hydratase-related protein [Acidimicrobiia bacterium]